RAAMADATSRVVDLPPRSGVRAPIVSASLTARSRSRAASGCPSCSTINAPVSTAAAGFATPFPAMVGAEPCTGSNKPPPRPASEILAFRVFAEDDAIDCARIPQRCEIGMQQLDGTEIDVQIQLEPQTQQDVPRVLIAGQARITQRTEEDCIDVVAQMVKCGV